ncbi:MAG: type II secretion system protein [Ignavibacteriales bacterium]
MVKIENIYLKRITAKQSGVTLMELVVSLGITAILATVIVVYCSNMVLQYKEQKQVLYSSAKTTYLLQVFNEIKNNPSVRVRLDNKAVEVSNNSISPTTKTVYYELQNAIYKDIYLDSNYKKTDVIAKDFSVEFSLESNASYSKDILKIVLTDAQGANWTRKISLRDCDIVEEY